MWTDCNCGRRNGLGDPCPHCGDSPEIVEIVESSCPSCQGFGLGGDEHGVGAVCPMCGEGQ
jgi:hypothetical protein